MELLIFVHVVCFPQSLSLCLSVCLGVRRVHCLGSGLRAVLPISRVVSRRAVAVAVRAAAEVKRTRPGQGCELQAHAVRSAPQQRRLAGSACHFTQQLPVLRGKQGLRKNRIGVDRARLLTYLCLVTPLDGSILSLGGPAGKKNERKKESS